MTTLALVALGVVWVAWLPGLLLTHLSLGKVAPVERAIVGLAIGTAVMPVVCFAAAMGLGTVVSAPFALSVGTLANVGLYLRLRQVRYAV